MTIRHLDFTRPETIHRIAALPFYGQAEALIRRVDPWWKVENDSDRRVFRVRFERDVETDCPTCGHWGYEETEAKTFDVEAHNAEEAEEIARTDVSFAVGGWSFSEVLPPGPPKIELPDELPPASVDTHPEGGDANAAPFMSGAVGEAETPNLNRHPKAQTNEG